jgi:hypothetical protein
MLEDLPRCAFIVDNANYSHLAVAPRADEDVDGVGSLHQLCPGETPQPAGLVWAVASVVASVEEIDARRIEAVGETTERWARPIAAFASGARNAEAT